MNGRFSHADLQRCFLTPEKRPRHLEPLPPIPDEVPVRGAWDFIRTADLVDDTRRLMERLDPSIDCIVGVARSGLLPAIKLACDLHLPLWSVSKQLGLARVGQGYRLNKSWLYVEHALVIDDTVATGRQLEACVEHVHAKWPEAKITKAAVYVSRPGLGVVDVAGVLLPGGHYLEWNWPNSAHSANCAFDFDGIICHDCRPEEDDDGPRYAEFLARVKPLYLPRRDTIPLIVTARHERYRAQTMAWLDRHGVTASELVMRDWEWDHGHDDQVVAAYKARHYQRSRLSLFAESSPRQADRIHRLTGKPVLCPAIGQVLVKPGHEAREIEA